MTDTEIYRYNDDDYKEADLTCEWCGKLITGEALKVEGLVVCCIECGDDAVASLGLDDDKKLKADTRYDDDKPWM